VDQQQRVLVIAQPADERKADKDMLELQALCLGLLESVQGTSLHLFHCLQIP